MKVVVERRGETLFVLRLKCARNIEGCLGEREINRVISEIAFTFESSSTPCATFGTAMSIGCWLSARKAVPSTAFRSRSESKRTMRILPTVRPSLVWIEPSPWTLMLAALSGMVIPWPSLPITNWPDWVTSWELLLMVNEPARVYCSWPRP